MRLLVWLGLQPRYKLTEDYLRWRAGLATEAEERLLPLPWAKSHETVMSELQKPNYALMTGLQLQLDHSPEAAQEIRRRNDMATMLAYSGVRWRLPEPPPQA